VQVLATLGQRHLGGAGFQVVSALGGLVSSASSTVASATLAMHRTVTATQAGVAVVLTSMTSAFMNLPIVQRQKGTKPAMRELAVSTALQIAVGVTVLLLQSRIVRLIYGSSLVARPFNRVAERNLPAKPGMPSAADSGRSSATE
jgi:energy-converting hydrogenase Eha subunit A